MPNSLNIQKPNPYAGRDPESLTDLERADILRRIRAEAAELEATWAPLDAAEATTVTDEAFIIEDAA